MAKISQRDWTLTQQGLNKLLLQISSNQEVAAQKYNETRQKLIKFFEYQNCAFPEEQADETINRLIKNIEEKDIITYENIGKYCYSIAQNVLKEYWRKKEKHPQSLEDSLQNVTLFIDPNKVEKEVEKRVQKERSLECLEMCLEKVEQTDKDLLYEYYQQQGRQGIESREAIAKKMGLPLNNLRVKIYRLKEKLEQCINNCLTK